MSERQLYFHKKEILRTYINNAIRLYFEDDIQNLPSVYLLIGTALEFASNIESGREKKIFVELFEKVLTEKQIDDLYKKVGGENVRSKKKNKKSKIMHILNYKYISLKHYKNLKEEKILIDINVMEFNIVVLIIILINMKLACSAEMMIYLFWIFRSNTNPIFENLYNIKDSNDLISLNNAIMEQLVEKVNINLNSKKDYWDLIEVEIEPGNKILRRFFNSIEDDFKKINL